jgi:hypothetical protein
MAAWAARNLLEIAVWTLFVCRDDGNARRLHIDHAVDLREITDAQIELAKQIPTASRSGNWTTDLKTLERRKAEIEDYIKQQGWTGTERHLSSAAAAAKVGLTDLHRNLNTIYSKYVHCTALSALPPIVMKESSATREWLVITGMGAALKAMTTLFHHLDSLGLDVSSVRISEGATE